MAQVLCTNWASGPRDTRVQAVFSMETSEFCCYCCFSRIRISCAQWTEISLFLRRGFRIQQILELEFYGPLMPFTSVHLKFTVSCHRGGDEAVDQMWVQPSRSCCTWWRRTLLKRYQSYCLLTVAIERIQVLLEGYGTRNYWETTV